jgi:hypothetical protein
MSSPRCRRGITSRACDLCFLREAGGRRRSPSINGALPLLDAPLSLVLPLAVAADAINRGQADT